MPRINADARIGDDIRLISRLHIGSQASSTERRDRIANGKFVFCFTARLWARVEEEKGRVEAREGLSSGCSFPSPISRQDRQERKSASTREASFVEPLHMKPN